MKFYETKKDIPRWLAAIIFIAICTGYFLFVIHEFVANNGYGIPQEIVKQMNLNQ